MATKARGTRLTGAAKKTSKPRPTTKAQATGESPAPRPPKRPGAPRTPKVPAPPPSGPRRAVFVDVENTSSEAALSKLLDELQIDLSNGATEIIAIGNWRLAGPRLGRSLAHRGATLVHSAPAARVPDWSDLWIAVQAGIWLGRSRPGDVLEIVSHDRAFDAVGDAATRLGVTFRRLTYHGAGAAAVGIAAAPEEEEVHVRERPGRRRSRRGRGRGAGPARAALSGRPAGPGRTPAPPAPRSPTSRAPAPAAPSGRPAPASPPGVAPGAVAGEGVAHGAPDARLKQIVARLAAADPSHTVTLDALTVALKAAGFQRPPGSPRLVTRLRNTKGIELLPNSRVRLVDAAAGAGPAAPAAPAAPADPPKPDDEWRRRIQFKPGY